MNRAEKQRHCAGLIDCPTQCCLGRSFDDEQQTYTCCCCKALHCQGCAICCSKLQTSCPGCKFCCLKQCKGCWFCCEFEYCDGCFYCCVYGFAATNYETETKETYKRISRPSSHHDDEKGCDYCKRFIGKGKNIKRAE